jgi:uroporphyrinogen-III synthase
MPILVCSLESRRAEEMRSLIERHGGEAFLAPSMQEVPLENNPAVWSFVEELQAGRIALVVFLTGVGARTLLEVIETKLPREEFFAALSKCVIAVRGPKPVAVLREWGVRIDLRAPEPNTWHELLATLESGTELRGQTIAVQEYGKPSAEFYESLQQRGATILPVPVYRWALPDDIEPLQSAVRKLVANEFDLLLITSAQQVHHLLEVAEEMRQRQACIEAVNRILVGSIGPTATETLHDLGLRVDIEPSHPKMGPLVKASLDAALKALESRL